MKKIIIITALFVFASSSAFAAGDADVVWADAGKTLRGAASGVGDTSPAIGKLSTKVGIAWQADEDGYAIITQHQSGVKAYGTSHDSTAIYVTDVTKGSEQTAPSTADSTDFVTGTDWKTM
jgi:hypothetical protein